MITVLADKNHYLLEQHLNPSIRLERYDPVQGWSSTQIRRADALLVRTVSPVNRKTLPPDHNIRFVGTASAGRDHLDEEWLASRDIRVVDAKGSNARCVAEYVAVAVLAFCESLQYKPADLTPGIVGTGYTGSATAEILRKLGMNPVLFDPPREERESRLTGHAGTYPFVSDTLEQVLSTDILSFHVPLDYSSGHPTFHWYDREKIRSAGKKLVINAARGGVVVEKELRKAVRDGHINGYVCDVWENEPVFDDETVQQAYLATPHIAGYSIEAKRVATETICRQLHRYFGLIDTDIPVSEPVSVQISGTGMSLAGILKQLHPAWSYDHSLRKLTGLPSPEKRAAFLNLRQKTALRNEFHRLNIPAELAESYPELTRIGLLTGP